MKISLRIRIKPLDLDSMDSDELKNKAQKIFDTILIIISSILLIILTILLIILLNIVTILLIIILTILTRCTCFSPPSPSPTSPSQSTDPPELKSLSLDKRSFLPFSHIQL